MGGEDSVQLDGIPRLDLRAYARGPGDDRTRFCAELRDGFCRYGFVSIEGHSIDAALIRRVYAHFEEFFSLSEDAKLACGGVAGGQRGYTPLGVEHAKDHPVPDQKAFFHVGQPGLESSQPGDAELIREAATYPHNIWPAQLPALEHDATMLFRALERCSTVLLEALETSFGLTRGVFAQMLRAGNSVLRALHYPRLPPDVDPRSERAAAHEDINLITLLCEATASGLEIRPPGGGESWLAVEVEPGQIIVDSGDMLSRITNDVIPATTHRVVTPGSASGRDRYSLPFFAHPRPSCDLSVIDAFVEPGRPVRYPAITAGRFLAERLAEIGLVSDAESAAS